MRTPPSPPASGSAQCLAFRRSRERWQKDLFDKKVLPRIKGGTSFQQAVATTNLKALIVWAKGGPNVLTKRTALPSTVLTTILATEQRFFP